MSSTRIFSAISAERSPIDSEAADFKFDYPVDVYIYLDDSSEVGNPAAFVQGSFL
jgi:hypothetical protein